MKEKMLGAAEVMRVIGLSRSRIYQLIDMAEFPAPTKLPNRTVLWKKSDVDAFVKIRKEKLRKKIASMG